MDCNKDEAARAKALAEGKLLDKDFVGARELIIKAQQLCKEVGDIDIQKMLTVCDVHCAAGAKENAQIDWYGILQVPEKADDTQIKKQYHKLALMLHPDKNKFGGAEAAFKLVGEANETLTDTSKRYLYDKKRVNQNHIPEAAFWTICPSCGMKYQYRISALGKTLRCMNRSCFKRFVAHEHDMEESSESSISETISDNEEERVVVELSESSISEMSSDNEEEMGVVESSGSDNEEERAVVEPGSDNEEEWQEWLVVESSGSDNEEGRAAVESSESSVSGSSNDSEEEIADHGPAAKVDDDFVNCPSLKRLRTSGMFCGEDNTKTTKLVEEIAGHNCMTDGANKCSTTEDEREDGSSMHGLDLDTDDASDMVPQGDALGFSHYVPHHVVSGTEKEGIPEKSLELDPAALSLDLEEDLASSAQVVSIMHGSALHDLMEEAVPSGANLQYAEVWKNAGVPPKSPSHQANVTPQKAWSDTPGLNLNFASHHAGENTKGETAANTAGPQDKEIAGYNGLINGVNICSNTQKKKDGAHALCGEKSFNKIQQMEREPIHGGGNGDGKEKVFHSGRSNGLGVNNDDASDEYKFTSVDPEFFDFGQLRDRNEFRTNQIWAVSDDQGCMPRFYAQITKVMTMPNFMLHFVWLEFNPTNEVEVAYSFSGLPVACGCFKYGKSDTSKETGMFSRTISYEKSKTRNCFEIYPKEGEVWALFKGWDIGWSSDPNNHKYWSHQYEVVQVLSDLTMSTSINVLPLVKIEGYDNLFMQSRDAAPYVIPQGDTLRFSHCIPHHVMSAIGERVPEGSLELDPAALLLPIDLEEAFPSVIPECSSERSQEHGVRYAGSSSGNGSHEESMSVWNGRRTTCMDAGIAAKAPKEVDSEHNTTSTSDDKFTFPDPDFIYFEQLPNEKGVPKVSIELDPAVLSLDMVDTFPCEIPECSSVSQDRGAKNSGLPSGNSSCKGSMNVGEGQHTTFMNAGIAAETPKEESRKHNTCSAEVAEVTDVDEDSISQIIYVHAESDFYDFSQSRLLQKISPGKIWALYSDVYEFPNYYGFIQKVDLKNGKIQVRWLDVCPCGDEEKRLLQEERTIGCGTFRLSRVDELTICADTDTAFSHCVVARSTGQTGEYEIIPHLGEIWAVYKNWRVGWTAQDFGRCEYELVEILGHTGSSIQVQLLRKVYGYRMVFMPYRAEGSVKTIRRDEYPMFSHQIPCFRLTCEGGGKLRGCLELDPLSLPEEFHNVR